jgi:hypothetical protein
MSAHIILGAVLHTRLQEPHGLGLAALAQAVSELVLQERRGRDERCGDCFESGLRLVCGRRKGGEVFEGEEGAEAGGERRRFRGEDLAEGKDGWV